MWELQFFKVFTKYMIETQCHQQRFIFVGFIPKINLLYRINVEKLALGWLFYFGKLLFTIWKHPYQVTIKRFEYLIIQKMYKMNEIFQSKINEITQLNLIIEVNCKIVFEFLKAYPRKMFTQMKANRNMCL